MYSLHIVMLEDAGKETLPPECLATFDDFRPAVTTMAKVIIKYGTDKRRSNAVKRSILFGEDDVVKASNASRKAAEASYKRQADQALQEAREAAKHGAGCRCDRCSAWDNVR